MAGVGAHVVLQDLEKGRPLEIDALLTVVQEMRRLVDVETPTIDTVLAWVQQMGREVKSVPPFPRFRWAKTDVGCSGLASQAHALGAYRPTLATIYGIDRAGACLWRR